MTPYRQAWRLAWPLILSNLSFPLLGIVDTAVVGHLPEPHFLGAVAIGALTFNVAYFLFGFLRMGTTGLTAQAFGRGDGVEIRASLARPLIVAGAVAACLLFGGPLLTGAVHGLFQPTARVAAELDGYLWIRLFGVPAGLANLVILGWLLGLLNARGPMVLLVTTNGLNIVLDLWFVLGLGWGVPGVALATVVAEYAGLMLGIWLVRRALMGVTGTWARASVFHRAALRRMFGVNRDIFLRTLCLELAFVGFTALGARQGEVILAANAVLLNCQLVCAFGLDGFAHAAEAMVGRAVGAGDRAGFRAATRANLQLALILAVLITLGFVVAGPTAIQIMTGLEAVRTAALTFLPYMVASPLISVWAFLFDGIFIGATRTAEMRNGMVVALATFGIASAGLLPWLGNHGLWLALLLFLACRGLWLGLVYRHIDRGRGFVPAPG